MGDDENEDEKEDERVSGAAQDSGDIVQIAESGDIDHRGAAAAEPSGTDTSDLTVPLFFLLFSLNPQPLLPSLPPLALTLAFFLFLFTRSLAISFSVESSYIKNLFHSGRYIFGIFVTH